MIFLVEQDIFEHFSKFRNSNIYNESGRLNLID